MLRHACGRLAAAGLRRPSASGGAVAAAAMRRRACAGPAPRAARAFSSSRRVAAAAGKAAAPRGKSSSGSGGGSGGNSSGGGSGGSGEADMYNLPALYDEVFSYRDFEAEAAFVRAAHARFCKGTPLRTLLELGCGPARHAALLAKGGARVWALDASGPMLEYAAGVAAQLGATVVPASGGNSDESSAAAGGGGGSIAFVQGDMADFSIAAVEGQLDVAVCLLGTFAHMTSNEAAIASLRCVARHLRPGGLLLLELAHPGDMFDGSLLIDQEGGEMWEVASSPSTGGGKLLVEWGATGDDFDPVTQVLARTVAVNRMEGEELTGVIHESVVRQRAFTLQELDLLARLAGLKLAASYGDLSLKIGLGHEDAYRLVACFLKE